MVAYELSDGGSVSELASSEPETKGVFDSETDEEDDEFSIAQAGLESAECDIIPSASEVLDGEYSLHIPY